MGVKADVEEGQRRRRGDGEEEEGEEENEEAVRKDGKGKVFERRQGERGKRLRRRGTVTVNVDVPGFRDDDALPTYLAEMIKEGIVGGRGEVEERLGIRGRFAWKLYVDVCLLLTYVYCVDTLFVLLSLIALPARAILSTSYEFCLWNLMWKYG